MNYMKYFKSRCVDANKGDFGKVGLLGGSLKYSGALKLSFLSLAALRSGSGIARIITIKETVPLLGNFILEQTLYVLDDNLNNIEDSYKDLDALGIGMGLTTSKKSKDVVANVLKKYQGKLIIDADGLNILADNMDLLIKTSAKVILTPHLKEMSRLVRVGVDEIKKAPIVYAKDLAATYNVIVVLKGHITYVTDGINVIEVGGGNPGMATAGSGDVLTGILTGMQGYLDYKIEDVAASVYLNGLAGEIASKKYTDIGMIARDTIESIPAAIKKVREEA